MRVKTWSLAIQSQLEAPYPKLKIGFSADEGKVEPVFLSQVAQAHNHSHTPVRLQEGPLLKACLSSGEL